MPLIFQEMIYRKDLKNNPHVFYVFGDNEVRKGFAGQASEMRGEPNAIGIATLYAPGIHWFDKDAEKHCETIDKDLLQVFKKLALQKIVVWPANNIGSGFARLSYYAPTIERHIGKRVFQLWDFANTQELPMISSYVKAMDVDDMQKILDNLAVASDEDSFPPAFRNLFKAFI